MCRSGLLCTLLSFGLKIGGKIIDSEFNFFNYKKENGKPIRAPSLY